MGTVKAKPKSFTLAELNAPRPSTAAPVCACGASLTRDDVVDGAGACKAPACQEAQRKRHEALRCWWVKP